jgi:glycosyltransferase involved in cell wall biosynthesis
VADDQALDADALGNALLGLAHRPYDFLLFSRSLAELPRVVAPLELRQSIVFARESADVFLKGEPPTRRLLGRLVRMPGLRDGSTETDLDSLLPGARVGSALGEVEWGAGSAVALRSRDCCRAVLAGIPSRSKPRVFVWPALWAVGGVERNAVEVMRHLRDRYEFVVITIERLNEKLGSLHHQLKGLASATYDLAELAPQSDYLSMLATLKNTWSPDLVWICNGSPWQCDHAAELRRIYADVPIVDQQVYDTRAGWINRYHEEGIQSFDRFVAINRRIHDAFVHELGMDPERIDLIYHAFDSTRFHPEAFTAGAVAGLKAVYGVPFDRPMFLFVGRMTPQKRPLDFVRLARRALDEGLDASFLLVGDGELAPAVDAAIAGYAGERVRRVPFTDRMPEIFAMAEGLVITSEYEGLPIAMLEALAMGLPVLSTDVGDVRLLLEEYGSGAIVPRIGDPEALALSFHAWHQSGERLRRAAERAAESVKTRFGVATIAARYEDCWGKAIRARAVPGLPAEART